MAISTHNVVGAFLDHEKAQQAVHALEGQGISGSKISVGDRDDEALLSKLEMREEVGEAVAGPAISLATKSQAKGAATWTVLGTAVGALLGLVVGLVALDSALSVVVAVIAFGFAGATTGFLGGGFTKPEAVEQAHTEVQERRTNVAVHSNDQDEVERAREILASHGADRIERFDSEGNPLPELQDDSGYDVAPSKTGRRVERES